MRAGPAASAGDRLDPATRRDWATLLGAFVVLLLTNVVLSWVWHDLPDVRPYGEATVRRAARDLTIACGIDAAAVLFAFVRLRRRVVPAAVPPGRARAGWLLALPLLVGLLTVNFGYHAVLRGITGLEPEKDALLAGGHATAWLLALLCVEPAIVEEVFFRRLAFDFLRQHTGIGTAAFASAAMFASAHTGGLLSFPVLLLFGVLVALLRARTGSLLLPMSFHFLHNLVVSLHDVVGA